MSDATSKAVLGEIAEDLTCAMEAGSPYGYALGKDSIEVEGYEDDGTPVAIGYLTFTPYSKVRR